MKSGQISIIVYAQLSSVAITQNLFFFFAVSKLSCIKKYLDK